MNKRTNTTLLLIAIAVVLSGMAFLAGFGAGFGTGRITAPQLASLEPSALERSPIEPPGKPATLRASQADDVPPEFDLLWEAWDALEEDFYGDLPETPAMAGSAVTGILDMAEQVSGETLDRRKTTDALIAAALATVQEQLGELPDLGELAYGATDEIVVQLGDEFTGLMTPDDAAFFNESLSGSFEGIGARVDLAPDGGVLVVEPFENQPAWNSGIRRDDIILAVDGTDVTEMTLSDAIQLIRGPKGTTVTLLVQSPDQTPREVQVTRDRILIPAVEYELLDSSIAYLRLSDFSSPSTRQVQGALDELLAQDPAGLILDLRGNPGGYLPTAVDISSEFVPDGKILVERFKDGETEDYMTSGRGRALAVPLVVLVNEGSASASEILAGAIQDSGRGILVGMTTFGKGSVQIPHQLSNGSLLRVTTAVWLTPLERQIHGVGLTPDIEVDRTLEDRAAGRDPQLDRAVEYLLDLQQ